MKLFLIMFLAFITTGLYANNVEKPKIIKEEIKNKLTNYRTAGNLQSNNPIKCVPLKDTLNTLTPADLFPGVTECLKKSKFENATHLLYIVRLYGLYDANVL